MKRIKIFLVMITASLLIGCNNVQGSTNNPIGQAQKDITSVVPVPAPAPQPEPEKSPIEGVAPVPEQQQTPTSDIINQENNIGEPKAKEIALSKVPNGVIKEIAFDYDDYIPNYDVKVVDSTYEYDFEINALDGSIVEREREHIERYLEPNKINQENNIGESKAKEIALSKVPNGVIREVSFDYDDYTPNYDIKVIDSTYEYDFEINALDGSIVEREREYIERYDD